MIFTSTSTCLKSLQLERGISIKHQNRAKLSNIIINNFDNLLIVTILQRINFFSQMKIKIIKVLIVKSIHEF